MLLDVNREAPANSPLGVELSKIRDRLNALERDTPKLHEIIAAQPALYSRLNALEDAAQPGANPVLVQHASRLAVLELWRQQSEAAAQPFPVTTKYEHLAQRVAELEQHPERLGSSEKHIDRRVEYLEGQEKLTLQVFEQQAKSIAALEARFDGQTKRLDDVASVAAEAERKLRLLEPIG